MNPMLGFFLQVIGLIAVMLALAIGLTRWLERTPKRRDEFSPTDSNRRLFQSAMLAHKQENPPMGKYALYIRLVVNSEAAAQGLKEQLTTVIQDIIDDESDEVITNAKWTVEPYNPAVGKVPL